MDDRDYRCPITGELMWEPATTSCGHTFEWREILICLRTKDSCPTCNQRGLRQTDVNKVIVLRKIIHDYAKRNSITLVPVYAEQEDIRAIKGDPPVPSAPPSAPPPSVTFTQLETNGNRHYSTAETEKLFRAVKNNNLQVVQETIARGANPDQQYFTTKNVKKSSLQLAVLWGYIEIVKFLLESGADPNLETDTFTTLSLAVDKGHSEIVKLLLAHNAFVNAEPSRGFNALQLACKRGSLQDATTLISAGAIAVDGPGWCPTLNLAIVSYNHRKRYNLPVDHDEYLQLVDLILSVDARVQKALDYCFAGCNNFLEIVGGTVECARHLIQKGAKLNNNYLYFAIKSGCVDKTRFLLEEKCNPNVVVLYDKVPLYHAIRYAKSDIISLLISYGADINYVDNCGDTPLIYCAKVGSPHNLQILLKAGADVTAKNHKGKTALDVARKSRSNEKYRLLKLVTPKPSCAVS